MPHQRLEGVLSDHVEGLSAAGARKGLERVVVDVLGPSGGRGPRFLLRGEGDRPFLRMNANDYLGLSRAPELIEAEEAATRRYGVGPGAVRFISGAFEPHHTLEARLAAFHGRAAGMIFSSAYACVLGALTPLITPETAVISDALNHNCIINAIRLGQPKEKRIYDHLDLEQLESHLAAAAESCRRALIITDGVFSMRGDHAPLAEIAALVRRYDERFAENAVLVVDDSHGVGAFGETGRGAEEVAGDRNADAPTADLLIATLGKAFGVNGGYVVASAPVIDYLRETAATTIYSNPITPGEAAAAAAAVDLVDSLQGRALLAHLRAMTMRFRRGLDAMGWESIPGLHPVAPLMVRDGPRMRRLVSHLFDKGVLATGLGYPVVPKGDESIRFQLSAAHTSADVDDALGAIAAFNG